ncbi:serine/arginine repetitive matrix protein 1 isoform X1 [Lingula anatina]|uniref:Serine/arginine repetitive matrix protein 1 isoform X1 n=1 Tax=Lingula anatina TaxID=7574 RepID=A0A1S3IW80_LINAN|nr:serine/arginine repetitive matrix protein 1 isoform X1 [Lingula anatina]|eukprot:XP_013402221.1 serine/arginine repetitive matrix protein 1 isoform X1 [Lingula anatina]
MGREGLRCALALALISVGIALYIEDKDNTGNKDPSKGRHFDLVSIAYLRQYDPPRSPRGRSPPASPAPAPAGGRIRSGQRSPGRRNPSHRSPEEGSGDDIETPRPTRHSHRGRRPSALRPPGRKSLQEGSGDDMERPRPTRPSRGGRRRPSRRRNPSHRSHEEGSGDDTERPRPTRPSHRGRRPSEMRPPRRRRPSHRSPREGSGDMEPPKLRTPIPCATCRIVTNQVNQMLEDNPTEQGVVDAVDTVCSELPSNYNVECEIFLGMYGGDLVDFLLNQGEPGVFCSTMLLC